MGPRRGLAGSSSHSPVQEGLVETNLNRLELLCSCTPGIPVLLHGATRREPRREAPCSDTNGSRRIAAEPLGLKNPLSLVLASGASAEDQGVNLERWT